MKVPEVGSLVEGINIIQASLTPGKINKSQTDKFAGRYRGNVRLSSGHYYTAEEFRERKEKVFREPLP